MKYTPSVVSPSFARGRANGARIMNAKANARRHEIRLWREARIVSALAPGEKLYRHWCQDTALGCTCTPHKFETLDCISIGRGVTAVGVKYDRCLGYNATWTSRDYRWQPAVAIVADEEAAA